MEDIQLIKRVKEGDQNAIRLLIENSKNIIWHIIISLVGRDSNSEDLFQESCLQVFKNLKYFRGEARLTTWIGSVTHNVCVDYLRKKKTTRSVLEQQPEKLLTPQISDKSWKQPEKEDLKKLVLEYISNLPLAYRLVITLYHLDERSYREISGITGMPDGTVKSYIKRGRELLREVLLHNVPDIVEILDDF